MSEIEAAFVGAAAALLTGAGGFVVGYLQRRHESRGELIRSTMQQIQEFASAAALLRYRTAQLIAAYRDSHSKLEDIDHLRHEAYTAFVGSHIPLSKALATLARMILERVDSALADAEKLRNTVGDSALPGTANYAEILTHLKHQGMNFDVALSEFLVIVHQSLPKITPFKTHSFKLPEWKPRP